MAEGDASEGLLSRLGLRRGLASKPLKISIPPAESSPDSTRLASWFFKPGSAGGCPGSEVQGVRIEWRGGSSV